MRSISKVRSQPAFGLFDRHSFSLRVAFDLIASDAIDREVPSLWMREVQAADRRGRPHREAFGQCDAGVLLGLQQVEQSSLLGVIRAGRISEGRANAAILFVDQVGSRQILAAAVTPFGADSLVQTFGERLGQAVGEGFGHDRLVIVVSLVELHAEFIATESGRDRERSDEVLSSRIRRSDVIGQRPEILLPLPLPLLAEHREAERFGFEI